MKRKTLLDNKVLLFFSDIIGIILTYMISSLFMWEPKNFYVHIYGTSLAAVISMVVFSVMNLVLGSYNTLWTFAGTKDYIRYAICCVLSTILIFITTFIFRYLVIPGNKAVSFSFRVVLLASVLCSIYMMFIRMSVRILSRFGSSLMQAQQPKFNSYESKNVLIVGAGSSATLLIKDMDNNNNLNFNIVGLVDDDKSKIHSTLNGYKVLGSRDDIPRICKENSVDEILLAISSASVSDKNEIIEICNKTRATLKTLPSVDQMISGSGISNTIRNVQIEDLLQRNPIVLNNNEISGYISDKVVLVTGGGGSIGSELCRQIMKYNPKNLIIVDIYENNAYDLQMELNDLYPENRPTVLIASVRDKKRLEEIFAKYKPYIVFHAAAHKHVPLMEVSPCEAIKNNVFGTYNVALCADKYNVKRFVMISTDKAVNPTNIMGATKRICEMIVQSMQQISNTEFVAVRFGNVLGSNGSVVPLFKRQIEKGGPITVTHKDITRFFMTIPEAAQLVLQAAGYANGGEIFVLDMGKPVKIYDLAKNLIRLSGYIPNVDIEIKVTGLRPGEKLYEELLMSEEGLTKTRHDKIFIGSPLNISMAELKPSLDMLETASAKNDVEAIKDVIEQVVPTYIRHAEKVNNFAKNNSQPANV